MLDRVRQQGFHHALQKGTVHLDDQPLPNPHISGERIEFADPVALRAGQVLRGGTLSAV